MSREPETVARTESRSGLDASDPGPQFHELWFSLQRWQWASLVVVPADAGGSAVRIAQSQSADDFTTQR